MNKVIITGNIFNEIDYKPADGQRQSYARFTVQARNYFNKKEKKQIYSYIPCMAYGHVADFLNKFFKKGSALEIPNGRLENNNWTDDEGKKHYDIVVKVDSVEFVHNDYKPKVPQPEYETYDPENDQGSQLSEEDISYLKNFGVDIPENQ